MATVVRCVFRDVLQYVLVLDYGIRCSKKRKKLHFKIKIRSRWTGWF